MKVQKTQKIQETYYDQVIEEHKELHQLLSQLHQSINNLAIATSNEEDWDDCFPLALNLLDEMVEHIVEHFEFEEEGGYLGEAVERAPWLSDTANKLQEQHQTFLNQLSSFRENIQIYERTTEDFTLLSNDFLQFISALHKHENEENRLVQSAFLDDIGTGD